MAGYSEVSIGFYTDQEGHSSTLLTLLTLSETLQSQVRHYLDPLPYFLETNLMP
jgi:hypothetical protein